MRTLAQRENALSQSVDNRQLTVDKDWGEWKTRCWSTSIVNGNVVGALVSDAGSVAAIEVESLFGDFYSTPFGVARRRCCYPAFHAGLLMFNPFGIARVVVSTSPENDG